MNLTVISAVSVGVRHGVDNFRALVVATSLEELLVDSLTNALALCCVIEGADKGESCSSATLNVLC